MITAEEAEDGMAVKTIVDNAVEDVQVAVYIEELTANAYVEFSGEGLIAAHAGMPLTGGEDGVVALENYAGYFAALRGENWNTMALPVQDKELCAKACDMVRDMRDQQGLKVQAVLLNYPQADYEGIISVSQGYETATEEISSSACTAYIAGLTAGSGVSASNTYHEISDAVAITGGLSDTEIEEALTRGQMVLSRRMDGAIVIEQDINTLQSYTRDHGRVFSKNRVIRCLDDIAMSIRSLFENQYIGKVDNDEDGRVQLKSDIVAYLAQLQDAGAIAQLDAANDVRVYCGDDVDTVIVDMALRPVDSMEKLYMTVELDTIS